MLSWGFTFFVWFMKTFGVLTWEIEGRELLAEPGVLVVANHPTLIDIVFIISMIPHASCIVKPSLYQSVYTKGPVSRAAYIASDEPETLIGDCVKSLGSGASLVIFPEGTRSVKGQPLRFRRGAAHVQKRSGCAVLLVRIMSVPPTLAKHEKWYQIPASRPHFKLAVERDQEALRDVSYDGPAADPRVITRRWLDYFSQEVMV
jgi:1-acyl-sn-glycerol-3-phosphate acyltransferase